MELGNFSFSGFNDFYAFKFKICKLVALLSFKPTKNTIEEKLAGLSSTNH